MRQRRLPLRLCLHGSLLLSIATVASASPSLDGLDNGRRQQQQQHGDRRQIQQEDEINLLTYIETYLTRLDSDGSLERKLFVTQTNEPSKIYKFSDLLASLPIVHDGIAGSEFYLGEQSLSSTPADRGWDYGLVNLAAFLAQCMKETIAYDACDENNWDKRGDRYPLSNACGQLGQSYQDYACPPGEEHMACEVDPAMTISATTHAKWYGAPPPLFCGPRSEYPWTGGWDYGYYCKNPWMDPPETCDVYEGQKAGRYDNEVAVPSQGGRTDVEGCCWWGRGVIQTTGLCNFGKLNYFLGARAAAEGRDAKYPDIDFCKTPDMICSSVEHPELKWIAGFYYWMKDVQDYNQDGWYYKRELHKFVNSGMTDMGFIDAISGIVNRGCHNPPCATGEVDGLRDRRAHFQTVLREFGLPAGGARPSSTLPPIPVPPAPPIPMETVSEPKLINGILHRLNSRRSLLETSAFSYESTSGDVVPSDLYGFDGFVEGVARAHLAGHAGKRFYVGSAAAEESQSPEGGREEEPQTLEGGREDGRKGGRFGPRSVDLRYGLVNVAAFLAQSRNEGVRGNACDEYHLDSVDGKFPISNSCGQFGDNYQEHTCSDSEKAMECPVVDSKQGGTQISKMLFTQLAVY